VVFKANYMRMSQFESKALVYHFNNEGILSKTKLQL